MATRGQSGDGVQLAHLNARLTAALDRLDTIRHAAADMERRRLWAEVNALRRAVAPLLDVSE
jgi:site-specific recombinase